jgi:hypothetical protein
MAVTVLWLALMATAAVWEVRCHQPDSRWRSLTGIMSGWWRSAPGRIVLIAVWAFVGWHVFARYTLPV